MDYNLDRYIDDLYEPYEDNLEERLRTRHSKDIKRYRLKTIKAGNMLISKIYPTWNINRRKQKESILSRKKYNPVLQAKYNKKKLQEKLILLVNGNFTKKDIWITTGYRKGINPSTDEEAKRNVINYIRRLQRYAEKKGYPKLKYIYVTEGSPGADGKRMHHHIITNFPDRDIAEKKWTKGEYPKAERLKPNNFGLEGLARYITKEAVKQTMDNSKPKSYGYSLNLYKPWEHETIADSKVTTKRANNLASSRIDTRAYFEKLYKGYNFEDMEINVSDYTSGYYFKTRMSIKIE